MSDEKTKVECRLTLHETSKANANVVNDLKIPDPESVDGIQAIEEATEMEEGVGDDSKSNDS